MNSMFIFVLQWCVSNFNTNGSYFESNILNDVVLTNIEDDKNIWDVKHPFY